MKTDEATSLLNLHRRPGTYWGNSSRIGAKGPCGYTQDIPPVVGGDGPPGAGHMPGQGRCLGRAAAGRCPLQSLFALGPPACSPGGRGAGSPSQLVAGAALQGLPQGPGHPAHILPCGVAAQQADPQHLGQGRGRRSPGAGPGCQPRCRGRAGWCPPVREEGPGCTWLSHSRVQRKVSPSCYHWPRPGPGALMAAGPLPSPPRAQGRPQSRCRGCP